MDDQISKSEKKRQAEALQALGQSLVDLSQTKLDRLPLPATLYQAIIDAKGMKSFGAKRRQAQFIGKLMRKADYEAILAAHQQLLDEASALSPNFHLVESWRDKLIKEGSAALTAFIDDYQPQDIQVLKQLVKKAQVATEGETSAAKALFRHLRSLIP
jgi:ribosome-associated protein